MEQLGLKFLQARCIMQRVIFVFKCLNCDGPEILGNNSLSRYILTTPGGMAWTLFYLFTLIAKYFNGLPKEVKTVNSVLVCKSKVRDIFYIKRILVLFN